jgi:hypothetical protein
MEIAGTTAREPIGFTNGKQRAIGLAGLPKYAISGIFGLFSGYFALTQGAYGL